MQESGHERSEETTATFEQEAERATAGAGGQEAASSPVEGAGEPASEEGDSRSVEAGGEAGDAPGEPTVGDEESGVLLLEPPDELQSRLEETERRLRAVSGAYKQLQDEMKALQERQRRLREEEDQRRRGEIVAEIFEPIQNLHRSLEAFRRMEGLSDEVLQAVQGIEMVVQQFDAALGKLGLEAIRPEGEPFDPNWHEALSTVVVTDPAQDGRVLQVWEAGYRVGGRVIQPARVVVGKYVPPREDSSQGGAAEA